MLEEYRRDDMGLTWQADVHMDGCQSEIEFGKRETDLWMLFSGGKTDHTKKKKSMKVIKQITNQKENGFNIYVIASFSFLLNCEI